MGDAIFSALSEILSTLEHKLSHISEALDNANKLKAIEMYKKVDPKILEKEETKKFLRYVADI